MPDWKRLQICDDNTIQWIDEDICPMGRHQVRIRMKYSGMPSGCSSKPCLIIDDRDIHTFNDSPAGWGAGQIEEHGPEAGDFQVGDWVCGLLMLQTVQNADSRTLHLLQHLKPEFSVFTEPGIAALRCVHAAGVRYGDSMAILGMGSVGLLALQYALLSGICHTTAVDCNPIRLKAAQRLGAHSVYASSEEFLAVYQSIGKPSRVLELTGTEDGLKAALESIQPGGSLVLGGVHYPDRYDSDLQTQCDNKGIRLCRIASQRSRFDEENIVLESLKTKRVIIWPIPFCCVTVESLEGKRLCDVENAQTVKTLIDYET